MLLYIVGVEAGELVHSSNKAAGRLATSGPQHSPSGAKTEKTKPQQHGLKLPLVPSKTASPIHSSSLNGCLKGLQVGQSKAAPRLACDKSAYDGPEHLTMIQVGRWGSL
jgi:hypothetical protein